MRQASLPGLSRAESDELREQAAALRRAERAKKKLTAKKAKPKRAKSEAQMTASELIDFINKPLTKAEVRENKRYRDELHTYSDAGDDLTINPTADNEQVMGLKKKAQRLEWELAKVGGKSRAPQLEADLETERQIAKTLELELARRDQALIDEFIAGIAMIRAGQAMNEGPKGYVAVANSHLDAVLKVLTRK